MIANYKSTTSPTSVNMASSMSTHSTESNIAKDDERLERIPTAKDEEALNLNQELSRHMSRAEEDQLSRVLSGNEVYSGPLPAMGPDNRAPPHEPANKDSFRVEFTGPDDPEIPLNWSSKKKLLVAGSTAFACLMVAWGSAIYGAAMLKIEAEYHVGTTPAALGISLYVLGFALGPIVWGPLSEIYGRKLPMLLGMFLFVCFTFATATGKDIQTIMICRFFSGATGASLLAVVPAVFADMFNSQIRGVAISIFTLVVVGGPMVAPVAGAYITASYLSWRWTMYVTGIVSGVSFLGVLVLFDETFQPIILARRAAELRARTGNWAIYCSHDTVEFDLKKIVDNNVMRPLKMMVTEPILLLTSIYHGFVYALLYMCLEAIPIVFEGYGFKGGNIMLPYLSVLIGAFIAVGSNVFFFERIYRKTIAASPFPIVPEARLPMMMVGGVLFTLSIFWIFWTGNYPKTAVTPNGVHWIVPTIGLAFFGYGFVALFLPIINYLLDCYLFLAASAMAGNTFIRSAMAAAFPLFATQMFLNLGVEWAGTLIGCLSVVMLPVPFLFYKFGPRLRSSSKFAYNLADGMPGQ